MDAGKEVEWEIEVRTHAHIRYLAIRVVLEVRRLFMLSRHKVDDDELIRDVALFGYHRSAAHAGGHFGSMKFERHR